MRNVVADQFRLLHRKVAQANRRLALVDLTGKVKAGSQDMEKRTVRLILGQTADGKEILSAPVRWDAGGAGRFKTHHVPKDGEQMSLHSASGVVGPTSLARSATYDKDNRSPSKSKDEAVMEFDGLGRITIGKDSMTLAFGDKAKVVIAKDKVTLSCGDGSGFEVTSAEMKMLGRLRAKGGSRGAVYVGSTDTRGGTNTQGNDQLLV